MAVHLKNHRSREVLSLRKPGGLGLLQSKIGDLKPKISMKLRLSARTAACISLAGSNSGTLPSVPSWCDQKVSDKIILSR
jgi:hypothetical protein